MIDSRTGEIYDDVFLERLEEKENGYYEDLAPHLVHVDGTDEAILELVKNVNAGVLTRSLAKRVAGIEMSTLDKTRGLEK